MNEYKIKTFQDLNAWKRGHELVLEIYELTKYFPKEEKYGLSGQLRRASVSVTSNIAEGFSRTFYKEKRRFYSIALGSLTEIQNQLIIAKDIGYIDEIKHDILLPETVVIHKLLNGLIKSCKSRPTIP